MGCCGQKREALKHATMQRMGDGTAPAAPNPPAPLPWALPAPPQQTVHSLIVLEYLERSQILVRGPVSGREYEFSAERRIQPVEVADAVALLRTRFFRRRS